MEGEKCWISDGFFLRQEISIDDIRQEWITQGGADNDFSAGELFYKFSKACAWKNSAEVRWEKLVLNTSNSWADAKDAPDSWGEDGYFGLVDMLQSGLLDGLQCLAFEYLMDFDAYTVYALCRFLESGRLPRLKRLCFRGVRFNVDGRPNGQKERHADKMYRSMTLPAISEISLWPGRSSCDSTKVEAVGVDAHEGFRLALFGQVQMKAVEALASWLKSIYAANLESLSIADTDILLSSIELILDTFQYGTQLKELEISRCSSWLLREEGMIYLSKQRANTRGPWKYYLTSRLEVACPWTTVREIAEVISKALETGAVRTLQSLILGCEFAASTSDMLEAFTLLLKCRWLRTLSFLSIATGPPLHYWGLCTFDAFAAALFSCQLRNMEHLELDGPFSDTETEALFASMKEGHLNTVRTLAVKDLTESSDKKVQAVARWLQSQSASNLRDLRLFYKNDNAFNLGVLVDACLTGPLPNLETIDFGMPTFSQELLLKVAQGLEAGKIPQLKAFFIFNEDQVDVVENVQRAFMNAYKRNKDLVAAVHPDLCGRPNHLEDQLLVALEELITQNKQRVKVLQELHESAEGFVSGTYGKVFLCGNPRIGKTTLRRALQKSSNWRTFSGFKLLSKSTEELPTRGIEVDHVRVAGIGSDKRQLELAFWDLAGQREYEVLHSAFLPDLALADGRATFFIIVCSSNADPDCNVYTARDSLLYWLKFIASNSSQGIAQDLRRQVLVVLNCFKGGLVGHDLQEWKNILTECQEVFKDVLSLHTEPFILNAKKPRQTKGLETHLQLEASRLLQQRQVPQICADVLQSCKNWASNEENKKYPVVSWQNFSKSVATVLVPEEVLLAAAIYLHEAGHLILFMKTKSQELPRERISMNRAVLILDPEWFCERIVGHLLLPDALLLRGEKSLRSTYMRQDGSLPLALVQKDQFAISEEKYEEMVEILVRLGLGYTLASNPENVFIPALIRDDMVPNWFIHQGHGKGSGWVMGFSLLSRDSLRTLLPVAVLRKLQVSLAQDRDIGRRVDCNFKAGVSRITWNSKGMGVIVEYHNDPKKPVFNRIDVLVVPQNSNSDLEREKQVQVAQDVVRRTLDVASDCCRGLELKRFVMKPWMCADGFVCLEDRDVRFSVEDMTDQLRRGIEGTLGYDDQDELFATNWYMHGRQVKFRDVLAEEDWKSVGSVFETRCELAEAALETLRVLEPTQNLLNVEESRDVGCTSTTVHVAEAGGLETDNSYLLRRIWSKVGAISMELKSTRVEMHQRMDRLDNSIQGVTERVNSMLKLQASLNMQIQSLETFSIMEKQTSVPRFAYLTGRQATQWVLPRVKDAFSEEAFLHFWCEAGTGKFKMHEVEGQRGVDVRYLKDWARQLAPILSWSLKVGFVAAKVAGSAVLPGLGILLPDNLNNIFQNASKMADGTSELLKLCSQLVDGNLASASMESSPAEERELRGAARGFVKEILKKLKPHEFKQQVGLTRIRIMDDDGATEKVAWVCQICCTKLGKYAQELDTVFL